MFGGLQGEATGESRQTLERGAVARVEQVITPLHRRAQGPMLGQGRLPAGGQHGEAIGQAGGQLLGGEHREPGGRQLDGQRQPVEMAADGRHGRPILLRQAKGWLDRPRTVDEELDRLGGGELGHR